MDNDRMLTQAALLTAVLSSLHFTDDIVRGLEPDGTRNLIMVAILTLWLWATLVLDHARMRRVLLLVGSLAAAAMPVLHRRVFAGEFAATNGGFFSVWLLMALGTMGLFSAILALRGLRARAVSRES